jgi:hypothetical protein
MTASQQVSQSAGQPRTRHFRDLIAWQKAMLLVRTVYTLTATFPKSEQFGLVSQMRRSAVSVPSNIAEGHGRLSDKSFRLFLSQARVLPLSWKHNCNYPPTWASVPPRPPRNSSQTATR